MVNKLTQYALCDWERNGYNDSDWYACIYDDVTNTISTVEIGTTRFAEAMPSVAKYAPLTLEVIEKARRLLEAKLFELYKKTEYKRVFEFDELQGDEVVRLIEKHKNMQYETEPCQKCQGSGKWINPRKQDDQRECFCCRGRGVTDLGKKKDDNGKQVWLHLPEGTEGIVLNTHAFGTFYDKGYKEKDRSNLNAYLRLDNKDIVRVPFKKLRLAEEPVADSILMERAHHNSFEYHFAQGFASWFAWYSNHYVNNFLKEKSK